MKPARSLRRTATTALLAVALGSAHGLEMASCADLLQNDLPTPMPWLPAGADRNVCGLVKINGAIEKTGLGPSERGIGAFKQDDLVGLRFPGNVERPWQVDKPWDESGHLGPPGQLWWSRRGNDILVLGQESYQYRWLSPSAVDSWGVFTSRSLGYGLVAAPQVTFTGGEGGSGDIPPGKIRDAKLSLDAKTLIGELSLKLEIDGVVRPFVIPITRNAKPGAELSRLYPIERFRPQGAEKAKGTWVPCDDETLHTSRFCEFPSADPPRQPAEGYAAYGAFFGPGAQLCAVRFELLLNSTAHSRRRIQTNGLVVMKLEGAS